MLDNLCAVVHHKLEELDHRAKTADGLSNSELQYADMLAHCAKSLATYIAMEESRGYSGASYSMADGRRDSERGYSYAQDRDSRGRYSGTGYSGADDMRNTGDYDRRDSNMSRRWN